MLHLPSGDPTIMKLRQYVLPTILPKILAHGIHDSDDDDDDDDSNPLRPRSLGVICYTATLTASDVLALIGNLGST